MRAVCIGGDEISLKQNRWARVDPKIGGGARRLLHPTAQLVVAIVFPLSMAATVVILFVVVVIASMIRTKMLVDVQQLS